METILSIAGKPGLYKMVSRGKTNLIVESLDDKRRRIPVFASDRVTSLSDVELWKVLKSVGEIENAKPVSFNYKKTKGKELREYFAKVLPSFDEDRVHDSDIKKLLQWYDILVQNELINFEELLARKESDEEEK